MEKETKSFVLNCTAEQNRIIRKELKVEKLKSGKSYPYILIEALYNLRSKK